MSTNSRVAERAEVVVNVDEELTEVVNFEEPHNEVAESPEDNVPTKFRGKQLKDVIESYQNLEAEYGRRNNEIGELRKLTDQLLSLKTPSNPQQDLKAVEVTTEDLLNNPSKTVNDAILNNPKIRELEEQLVGARIREARSDFERKHPQAYKIADTTEFQDWILASPVRQRLYKQANEGFDYSVGDELFSLYGQLHQPKVEKTAEEQEAKRKKDLRSVSTERGSTTATSKKVYRRADLINLRIKDPNKYDAMENEILKAYAEGRVR